MTFRVVERYESRMKIEIIPIPEGPGLDQFRTLEKFLPELCLFRGSWVAGGTARRLFLGLPIDDADIDLFFTSSATWEKACSGIEKVANARLRTRKASTYRVPVGGTYQMVQPIKKSFPRDMMDMFKSFDYQVCQFATDGRYIAFPEQSREDVMKKHLRIGQMGSLHVDGFYVRLQKYMKYGFVPTPDLLGKILHTAKGASTHRANKMSESETYSDTPKEKHELGPGWETIMPKVTI
jgi:hypothetical protein